MSRSLINVKSKNVHSNFITNYALPVIMCAILFCLYFQLDTADTCRSIEEEFLAIFFLGIPKVNV